MNLTRTLLAGVFLSGLAVGGAHARELIYSSPSPDTFSLVVNVAVPFFERIKESTKGEITGKIVGGGVLVGAAQTLAAIKSGSIDTAELVYNYQPTNIPGLTFLGDLYAADTRISGPAMTETLLLDCPQCMNEMKSEKAVVMFNPTSETYSFLCAKKPVVAIDDMKGLKLRGTGSMGQLAAGLGGTPVQIAWPEIYEALQRGTIECTLQGTSNLKTNNYWDVVKYVTPAPLGLFSSMSTITVNLDVWKSFTPDQRRAFLDSAAQGLVDYQRTTLDNAEAALKEGVEKHGVTVAEPSAELLAAVAAFRKAEVPGMVEAAKGRGLKDPQAIADAYFRAYDKWAGIVAEIGTETWGDAEWDAYSKRIKSEIYDKLPDDFATQN